MNKTPGIPPFYFILCLILSIFFKFIFPDLGLIPFPYNLFGILVISLGLFFIIWSGGLLKKHNTPHDFRPSTCLVTEGPYRLTRNPMYLGMTLVLLGVSLFLGNLISFISPLAFLIIINFMFIPIEEKKMLDTFGDKYLEYSKKIRPWI